MNIRIHICDIPSEKKWIADYFVEQDGKASRSSWASDMPIVDDDSMNRFLNAIVQIIQKQLKSL